MTAPARECQPEIASDDGGPAFPVECAYQDGKPVGLQTSAAGGWETGMTLRDYFAAKALIAISGLWKGNMGDFDNQSADLTAKAAYHMADAMLRARAVPLEMRRDAT